MHTLKITLPQTRYPREQCTSQRRDHDVNETSKQYRMLQAYVARNQIVANEDLKVIIKSGNLKILFCSKEFHSRVACLGTVHLMLLGAAIRPVNLIFSKSGDSAF